MKVDELLKPRSGDRLPPQKAKLLQYLQEHPDEVFPYRDETLGRALGMKQAALSFGLWQLCQQGLIGREAVGRRLYFGSHEAIERLRHDPKGRAARRAHYDEVMARVRLLGERIHRRIGDVDVLKWLDESRESHP